jgi:predicted AlkP superfamily pyrophosphatase or phosphodiesterase
MISFKNSIVTALAVCALTATASYAQQSPKLILQITVDQLRGDLIHRHLANFDEGGFRYLLDEGVVYSDAHHAHSNTETIVGHTTLSTGAHPSEHGMIANVWFDRALDRLVYNIEDPEYFLLSSNADVNQQTEIDPTQAAAGTDGRSPANILTSTFSDELVLFTAGQAKIFGVSVKDRGAVAMAGHAGKAFWFSKQAGEFVTSNFYYDQYPDWVVAFNEADPASVYADTRWDLLLDKENYLFGDMDDQPWETDFPGYGRTFPHSFGSSESKYFTTLLTLSPAGDRLTLDFAMELMEQEAIGQDDITDYLSVSFSSTDYVGHIFGPSSLEMEDNLIRLDRTLAELFRFVDEQVGLANTLIVLSADHGGAEVPEYLKSMGINAGYVDPAALTNNEAMQGVQERFGTEASLILEYFPPYIYLDEELIASNELDIENVQEAVAEAVTTVPGVLHAFTASDLEEGDVGDHLAARAVTNNHHPQRSGDIYLVFLPHYFIGDFDGLTVASHHGSPWSYDTHVPIMFAGMGLESKTISERVRTTDIAPTLSVIVGAKPPSGASGSVLKSVHNSVNAGKVEE